MKVDDNIIYYDDLNCSPRFKCQHESGRKVLYTVVLRYARSRASVNISDLTDDYGINMLKMKDRVISYTYGTFDLAIQRYNHEIYNIRNRDYQYGSNLLNNVRYELIGADVSIKVYNDKELTMCERLTGFLSRPDDNRDEYILNVDNLYKVTGFDRI